MVVPMPSLRRRRQDLAACSSTLIMSAIAAAVYYPLTTFGPEWLRGARLPDMDPPFDLEWLHNFFAWTVASVGQVLFWGFVATIVLLPIVALLTKGYTAGPPAAKRADSVAWAVPVVALAAVPALAFGWLVLTQFAGVIAPWFGMYHGDINPAVP
jgi:hypothetical protein